jgi:hypothetical protein
MVKRDRVRKSSGWTEGVAKVETECAADLIARNDAVRLDLKVEPRRGKDPNEADRFAGVDSGVTGSLSSLISMTSQSSSSVSSKGWSEAHSSEWEYRGCRLSSGLFWLPGVGGRGRLDGDARPCSRDGIESLDIDLRDNGLSCSDSLPISLSLSSSGGLRRMSRGELLVPSRK